MGDPTPSQIWPQTHPHVQGGQGVVPAGHLGILAEAAKAANENTDQRHRDAMLEYEREKKEIEILEARVGVAGDGAWADNYGRYIIYHRHGRVADLGIPMSVIYSERHRICA